VIDWPNAARGDGLADVASTWVILTTSRLEGSLLHRRMLATGRRLFAAAFLVGFDRRAVFGQLPVVVGHGLATAMCLRRSVSVSVGCWRSLAIGGLQSSWTLALGEALVGVLGPGQRLAALVRAIAEPTDRRDQLPNAGQVATTQRRALADRKDHLDQVQPPAIGRGEVRVDPRVAGQPGLDLGVLGGGGAVEHDMQLPARGRLGDELQEG